jgi:hypothetical protein
MSQNGIAVKHRRFARRYGRTEVICDATSLLMDHFDLDPAQALAQLVKVSKRHSESIEAAARLCIAAELRGDGYSGTSEPVGEQPGHRRVAA